MKILFLIVSCLIFHFSCPATGISIKDNQVHFIRGEQLEFLEDTSGKLSLDAVVANRNFKTLPQPVPNFGHTRSVVWLKFDISNLTNEDVFLEIGNPLLNHIEVYSLSPGKSARKGTYGNQLSFYKRTIPVNTFLVDPSLGSGEAKTIFIRLESTEPIEAPIHAGTLKAFYAFHHKLTFFEGIYFGFVLLILLYNLFLFFSVRDDIYLYYVIYVFTMILMMAHFKGYTFEYLWPDYASGNKFFSIIFSSGGIAGLIFSIRFLKSRHYTPFLFRLSFPLIAVYAVGIALNLTGNYFESNAIEMSISMIVCLYLFILGIAAYIKGNKAARFYIYAFTCIIIGAITTTLYYLDVLPYNSFNANAVLAGSALELLFLSLALADKINVYKEGNEKAQKMMIGQLKENEQLKDEMNRELEKKVKERTKELNEKSAQVDLLVYKASHDINGPLRSIVSLTRLGIQDLKDNPVALSYLENIHSASSKVTGMVSDLLNLARIKETQITYEQVNASMMIEEILASFKNLPEFSRLNFEVSIPEGFNLVSDPKTILSILQNIVENAIKYSDPSKTKCEVKISVSREFNNYVILCEDNGIGIPENMRDKIFEMFYKVDERSVGSGLGLFLVREMVRKLGGNIEFSGKEGEGSTFRIHLPVPDTEQTAKT